MLKQKELKILKCEKCGKEYVFDSISQKCPECGGTVRKVIVVRYNRSRLAQKMAMLFLCISNVIIVIQPLLKLQSR